MSRLILCLIALSWLSVTKTAAAAQGELELAVKATYLAKLLPFVVWPNQTTNVSDAPFAICVIGKDPFGPLLDRAVAQQTVGGHAVVIHRHAMLVAQPDCSVEYIGDLDPDNEAATVVAARGQPVLTVTDQVFDPKVKGIINFVVIDNRVRLEIDEVAAKDNGIGISSKLLSLALAVRSPPGSR